MSTLPITFLSDYGDSEEFAGVCRAVMLKIAPEATVIDLTHGILPGAVGAAAISLASALPYTPAGIHLAVVDPSVGSSRRAVAVRVAEPHRILVGPDNGLLRPAIDRFGGAVEVIEISNTPVRLNPVSATFHGRDIFAPVAGHLAAGADFTSLGVQLPTSSLMPLDRPRPTVEAGLISGRASAVDRFGNIRLDIDGSALDRAEFGLNDTIRIEVDGHSFTAVVGRTFADARAGSLVVYRSSVGVLAIAANRGSAAAVLGVDAGGEIKLLTGT